MSRVIAVLRPEPGNRVTATAIEAAGRRALRLPLFAVHPVAWEAPDPTGFDALLLTSANAVRHAGPQLARLYTLPVYAVGAVTAEAATRAGLRIAATGSDGAGEIIALAQTAGIRRALHLAGRERTAGSSIIIARVITVYASDSLAIAPEIAARLHGSVALVHSPRAAARLQALVPEKARKSIAVVAVSQRAAASLGSGWEQVRVPSEADPAGLVSTAIALAD
jgi:uroporphyrinogen-III synthase